MQYVYSIILRVSILFSYTVYAFGFSGTVSPVNKIDVQYISQLNLTPDQFASDGIFVNVYNNDLDGYTLSFHSANGGYLHDTADSSLDGSLLEVVWSCTSPNDVNNDKLITPSCASCASQNHSPLSLNANETGTMLTVANPAVSTFDAPIYCNSALASGELTGELYAGTFTETITVTINNS